MSSDRPSTVGQLLSAPALHNADLLAGDAGLGATVTDVALRTRIDKASPPHPGEVVLLDAAAIEEHLYQIDVAIRVIADVGSVALIVTNPCIDIGLGARRLATRFGIPLVVVTNVDPMSLTHRLRAQIWAPDVEQASIVNALLETFSGMRLTTVESVVETLAELGTSRVCVLGRDHNVVAGEAIELGGRRLAEDQAYLIDYSEDAALHSAAIVLVPGEEGAYWLIAESSGSDGAQRLLRSLLQIGSWYLAALLASVRISAESDARRRIAVFNEILDASDMADRDVQNQMLELGWTATGWNTGIHIKLRGADAGRIVQLHAELSARLRSAGLVGPLVERNDGWSGWITATSEPTIDSYSQTVNTLSGVLQDFVSVHSGLWAHGGIGRPYQDLKGLRSSLTEAHEAAVLSNARSTNTSGATHIDKLGVQRVLMGWFSSEDFARYALSILDPILDLDTDHELLRTLETYLDSSCSTTDSAHQLKVHRNTVANRINRITELLDARLDDPETRLSLQLACRVIRLNR